MRSFVLSIVAALILVASPINAEDNWFDMEKCGICNCMADHKELMTEIKWEVHKIDNGMLMVSMIPEAHKATMKKAHEKMELAVKRMEGGEKMELCGFCNSFGALMKAGAKEKKIETAGGYVHLVTSDNPEVIKKIHEHTAKTQKAHKEMMAKMAGGAGDR